MEAADAVNLRRCVLDALAMFGVEAAFFVAPLSGDTRIGRVFANAGLPFVWERHYRAHLHLIDPLPDLALERVAPIYWPDDLQDVPLDERQRRFLALAAKYGLGKGIAIPCFGPQGRSGLFGAAWPHESAPCQVEVHRMKALAQSAFERFCKLVPVQQGIVPLSNRELEVLHWIAKGKSNPVIAELLAISPSSVDVYVRRIFAKLEVTDRTTASVKAYSMGLIVSTDYQRHLQKTASEQRKIALSKDQSL
jgi:DNA-binding CsgD family transcriptional regulator